MMGLSSLAAGGLLLLWSQVAWAFYVLVGGIGALQAATLYEPAFAVVARRVGPGHSRAGITALTLSGRVRQHGVHSAGAMAAEPLGLA